MNGSPAPPACAGPRIIRARRRGKKGNPPSSRRRGSLQTSTTSSSVLQVFRGQRVSATNCGEYAGEPPHNGRASGRHILAGVRGTRPALGAPHTWCPPARALFPCSPEQRTPQAPFPRVAGHCRGAARHPPGAIVCGSMVFRDIESPICARHIARRRSNGRPQSAGGMPGGANPVFIVRTPNWW